MTQRVNELYVAIIPIIHLTQSFGLTEQVMTLFPDKNFATSFTKEEVNGYLITLKNRADQYLTGGNVQSYDIKTVPAGDGLFFIRVIQNVSH